VVSPRVQESLPRRVYSPAVRSTSNAQTVQTSLVTVNTKRVLRHGRLVVATGASDDDVSMIPRISRGISELKGLYIYSMSISMCQPDCMDIGVRGCNTQRAPNHAPGEPYSKPPPSTRHTRVCGMNARLASACCWRESGKVNNGQPSSSRRALRQSLARC
jgi:hypothetical protein